MAIALPVVLGLVWMAHGAMMMRGTVRFFEMGRGYGFIAPHDPGPTRGRDVFVSYSSIVSTARFRFLLADQRVQFELVLSDSRANRYRAGNVTSIGGGPIDYHAWTSRNITVGTVVAFSKEQGLGIVATVDKPMFWVIVPSIDAIVDPGPSSLTAGEPVTFEIVRNQIGSMVAERVARLGLPANCSSRIVRSNASSTDKEFRPGTTNGSWHRPTSDGMSWDGLQTGVVVLFSPVLKCGLIRLAQDPSQMLIGRTRSSVRRSRTALLVGETVEFEIKQDDKGRVFAHRVTRPLGTRLPDTPASNRMPSISGADSRLSQSTARPNDRSSRRTSTARPGYYSSLRGPDHQHGTLVLVYSPVLAVYPVYSPCWAYYGH